MEVKIDFKEENICIKEEKLLIEIFKKRKQWAKVI
jgi:hypothetical protein